MVRLGVAAVAAAGLSACVGQRVEHGFTEAVAASPPDAVKCAEAHWRPTHRVRPEFPDDLAWFSALRDDAHRGSRYEFALGYDIDESGSVVNVRHEGPDWQLDHGAVQSAIRASADALMQWRFEWEGEGAPRFALGCVSGFDYMMQGWTPALDT